MEISPFSDQKTGWNTFLFPSLLSPLPHFIGLIRVWNADFRATWSKSQESSQSHFSAKKITASNSSLQWDWAIHVSAWFTHWSCQACFFRFGSVSVPELILIQVWHDSDDKRLTCGTRIKMRNYGITFPQFLLNQELFLHSLKKDYTLTELESNKP